MSEPVGHKKRFFIGGLDNILQSVQLPIVELNDLTGIGIYGTICELWSLPVSDAALVQQSPPSGAAI